MGTPEFAVPSLERLISDGHSVGAVFTQPDRPAGRDNKLHEPPVKSVALRAGISCYQPERIKTNQEVRRIFEELSPDACIVAAYGRILPAWLLAIPRLGCINVHSSLLPKYRGAAPINWAIANGEQMTGVTIMQMDPGMDTGPIWTQKTVDIEEDESAPELSVRLARVGAELLSETLPLIERRIAVATPQDESEATYAPMLKREDGLIDFAMAARQIVNRLRGFQPWPGAYTMFRGSRLIVWRARAVSPGAEDWPLTVETGPPGAIAKSLKEGLVVTCGNGTALLMEELQLEGKRRVPARDFANGMRLEVGTQIG